MHDDVMLLELARVEEIEDPAYRAHAFAVDIELAIALAPVISSRPKKAATRTGLGARQEARKSYLLSFALYCFSRAAISSAVMSAAVLHVAGGGLGLRARAMAPPTL